ncbi:MAG: SUF system NifU family Fe-S cluster assembly protein [Chloroflexi bacterium]|nr:SUF system NifU family Fe-S cluster assembly protein [Chloroflexota bacterium]
MVSELRELYQDIVLDHNSRPRNFKSLPDADRVVDGYNPLCGDKIKLFVKLDGNRIVDIGFQGSGCAISRASASLMTQEVKGKSKAAAEALFGKFHHMVTHGRNGHHDSDDLGELEVMAGVAEFPSRVKCATLAWHTLHAALEGKAQAVSTE